VGRRRAGAARLTEESELSQHTTAVNIANPEAVYKPIPVQTGRRDLLTTIQASLDDDKAEDVTTISLAGKSEMADHMVIATGRSSRQVSAIAEKLAERLKQGHGISVRTEGKEHGDWVLIDAGDVIVHLFRPEVREFYQLEKMWQPVTPRPKPTA
jgi:ribosome-associated protein